MLLYADGITCSVNFVLGVGNGKDFKVCNSPLYTIMSTVLFCSFREGQM